MRPPLRLPPMLLLATLPWLAASWPEQAGAHVHGEARLEIVLAGQSLELRLDVPQESLLGFERAPRSASEQQAWTSLQTTLGAVERLFILPPEADCRAVPGADGARQQPAPASSEHPDLVRHYRWVCQQPARLRELGTRLFSEFPRLQRIRVEYAGPDGQKSGRLSARHNRFAW
ncbi:DUF2796 domain-containing protein [Dechloromonas sp. ZY10]|uniref:ZrgA family zinc uptake protein n=1 Tax=Dechloromonas aquae TaxID=2664436 RepID=UPI003527004F